RRLRPVRDGSRHAEERYLEREQEHAIEEQHQPRRIAEEMRREKGALLHRRQQRYLREAKEKPGDRTDCHRQEADREIEQKAAREQRRPLPERREDRRIGHLGLRLRYATGA